MSIPNRSKENYQKEMDKLLESLTPGEKPRLLLHSCCAPCSSYVLEYLSPYFQITDFYYNPNITPESEYRHRTEELQRLIREMLPDGDVHFLEGRYEPEKVFAAAKGLENEPEGGARCLKCFELRLREAAEEAVACHCDYFATTLTISPLKNADHINAIGRRIAEETGVKYLASDFKKKNGYRRSTELSREYHLYRQNYCGCVFSRKEAAQRYSADKQISSTLGV